MPRYLPILFVLFFFHPSKEPVGGGLVVQEPFGGGPVVQEPAAPPARPFPQHVTYQKGCILPNHISRQRMDDSVRTFYKVWKRMYIKKGCNAGEYYVWFEGPVSHNKQCVSEGQ